MSITFKEENIKSFSSPEAVAAYSSTYIRSSEAYIIKKYMPQGSSVLDVGCGTGRTTAYIHENKCKVIGIDIAEPLIRKAKEMYPNIDFAVMDAAHIAFPDNTFDAVFFSFNGLDNFSSLEERHEALQELLRVTKPSGFLIYSSHNSIAIPRNFSSLTKRIKNIFRYKIGPHWRSEDHGFGRLFQYHNNVYNECKQLRNLDMKVVEVIGNGKVAALPKVFMPFLEKFPTYIIQK